MSNCGFCGKNIERGTGMMFVFKNAKIVHFCSSKCEKNLLKLKRKPHNVKWTKEYERVHKK